MRIKGIIVVSITNSKQLPEATDRDTQQRQRHINICVTYIVKTNFICKAQSPGFQIPFSQVTSLLFDFDAVSRIVLVPIPVVVRRYDVADVRVRLRMNMMVPQRGVAILYIQVFQYYFLILFQFSLYYLLFFSIFSISLTNCMGTSEKM